MPYFRLSVGSVKGHRDEEECDESESIEFHIASVFGVALKSFRNGSYLPYAAGTASSPAVPQTTLDVPPVLRLTNQLAFRNTVGSDFPSPSKSPDATTSPFCPKGNEKYEMFSERSTNQFP